MVTRPASHACGLDRLLAAWIPAEDGSLRRGPVFLVVLAAYAFFAATYLPINFYTIGRPAHRLFLPGEARIPFLPEMEFLYLLGYVLPLLLVWQVSSVARLARMLRAFLLTLAVAYATYLTFPVYFERPVLVVDSVATFLLSLEYMDPSYNHFPSLHVGLGVLVYLALRDRPACRWWLGGIVAGMAVSTVFVKQHYAVDVAYGAMLGAAAWAVAGRWSRA